MFLRKKTDIFEPLNRRVLHIAPEKCLDDRLKKMYGSSYLTADIQPGLAMECMDITDIKYNDETFDVIFCSHVLEHISDDKKAINELTRVLKSGGWAIILVPIDGDYTHEDPAITDPKMREELYGQSDHVRLYGLKDYLGLLESTGLEVSVYFPQDILPPEDIIHFGIIENAGEIFLCKKPCHSK
ncbi:class I SAM-dependent methyltransferase [Zhongshania sp.]|uniref:class I SAM-dependent methyltransferase n=1 Tax=Zhongshania sp. TaxID=1971902 RepID=UPI0035645538